MPTNLDKFKTLLEELFMFDQADLDFGIYRIMNAKRDEIGRFLDKDLLPQVKASLVELESGDRVAIKAEIDKAVEASRTAGIDPQTSPRVKELQAQYEATTDVTKIENEVFSDLTNFFRRYYSEGDFLSLRRYKEGVYAIPYEGEEVKLHWANADQYYIKSSEYFRNYTFKLPDGKRVHFKIVEADIEANNNKPAAGQDRRFMLVENDPVSEESGDLVIRFEYKADPERRSGDQLNQLTVERIMAVSGLTFWKHGLGLLRPTRTNTKRTLLDKHLSEYTARNTFDYFIHKDLGKFLRRELDFFIKNEVMHLDDIEAESAPRVEQYLAKIKAIRRIAHKIIDFLNQLENFQKTLWLKKKFVVETNYCITLDLVPEALYGAIAANDAQREEWVKLFAIDRMEMDLTTREYSEPISIEFLRANQNLILDTRWFDDAFRTKLLASISSLDDHLNGVIVQSDNFQALRFLKRYYRERIKCIYADPPYNTSEVGFVYKNEYRHSSWCAMLAQCMEESRSFLQNDGVIATAIDDFELHHLGLVCDEVFGKDTRLGTLVVEIKPSGRTNDNFLATSHEYYIFNSPNPNAAEIAFFELTEDQKQQYAEEDKDGAYKWRDFLRTGGYSTPEERPNSYYPIYFNPKSGSISLEKTAEWEVIWPIDSEGRKRVWRKTPPSFLIHLKNGEIKVTTKRESGFKVQIIDRIKLGVRPKSVWIGKNYDASSHGTKLLKSMFGEAGVFTFPKSIHATKDVLHIVAGNEDEALILDFFAGSGTTGHATVELNRKDGGSRKYILIEKGEYFNDVLLPRLKKAAYSVDWNNGKPTSNATGISHVLKYIRLESYEDSLNNLELKRNDDQQQILLEEKSLREDYMLKYMLDVESRDSASLLNLKWFEDPFSYKLNITTGSVGETKPTSVDLVETFNYLLGLRVKHIDTIRGYRIVQGTNPGREKVLIIWRNTKEKSNDDLDDLFVKQKYNTKDNEFDLIYVNGDNNLENLRRPDETWKVQVIEHEFKRLMFEEAEK